MWIRCFYSHSFCSFLLYGLYFALSSNNHFGLFFFSFFSFFRRQCCFTSSPWQCHTQTHICQPREHYATAQRTSFHDSLSKWEKINKRNFQEEFRVIFLIKGSEFFLIENYNSFIWIKYFCLKVENRKYFMQVQVLWGVCVLFNSVVDDNQKSSLILSFQCVFLSTSAGKTFVWDFHL